jgi:hypothetical protein
MLNRMGFRFEVPGFWFSDYAAGWSKTSQMQGARWSVLRLRSGQARAKRTSAVRGARRASAPFDDAQGDRSVTSDDNDSPFVLSLVEA